MKKKLINRKEYPASCAYCEYGRLSPGGLSVLCVKKGIMSPEGKCRKFVYDPTRREPKVPLAVPKADTSDYEF